MIAETNHLPSLPGVYLFKDEQDNVLYVGKAKDLKKRVASYFRADATDLKSQALTSLATKVEHIVTHNEIEAMLLEAQLIKNYQPQFNILLKDGQPYLYILFTQTEVTLVRNKQKKGTYFGPFLEKGHARRVYNFLLTTFRLKLCNKKIPSGCLYYHLGSCAGSCKENFDLTAYKERLALAQKALEKNNKDFLLDLKETIENCNKELNYEKSQELYSYYQAFEKVFSYLETNFAKKEKALSHKHVWVLENSALFLFDEQNGITKKKEAFFSLQSHHHDYIESYYYHHDCPQTIITNFEFPHKKQFELFLQKLHKKSYPVSIFPLPQSGYLQSLIHLATTHAQQELERVGTLGASLKKLLELPKEPQTIDCFDISHKQGQHIVGSCIRFCNGKPDRNNFRRFKIKTLTEQNDYACLQEIVSRRYKDADFPDLIIIDGGKGQLNAIQSIVPNIECASLAKKEETIFSKRLLAGKKLNINSFSGQFLIALRDYAHHFAISYHRSLSTLSN